MRVLVTRPDPDAAETVQTLERAGHRAVSAPVLALRLTGDPLPHGTFDALVFTSRHAPAAADALDRTLPVFAVGRRTGAAARAAGFGDVRLGGGDAAGLAALLRLTLPAPARLLYLAGRDRKPALETALGAAGHALAVAEVYAAEPVERWPAAARDALRAGAIEGALHYSRRSAALALDVARREGLEEALLPLRHFCLSDDAAAPLLARGAARVDVAERPDEASLLALLPAGP